MAWGRAFSHHEFRSGPSGDKRRRHWEGNLVWYPRSVSAQPACFAATHDLPDSVLDCSNCRPGWQLNGQPSRSERRRKRRDRQRDREFLEHSRWGGNWNGTGIVDSPPTPQLRSWHAESLDDLTMLNVTLDNLLGIFEVAHLVPHSFRVDHNAGP